MFETRFARGKLIPCPNAVEKRYCLDPDAPVTAAGSNTFSFDELPFDPSFRELGDSASLYPAGGELLRGYREVFRPTFGIIVNSLRGFVAIATDENNPSGE